MKERVLDKREVGSYVSDKSEKENECEKKDRKAVEDERVQVEREIDCCVTGRVRTVSVKSKRMEREVKIVDCCRLLYE